MTSLAPLPIQEPTMTIEEDMGSSLRDTQPGKSESSSRPLGWREVYAGSWSVDRAGYVWAESLKGGGCTPAQVRGWGYLTGHGHGALRLSDEDAVRIQGEIGRLIAAAPDLLEAAKEVRGHLSLLADGLWEDCPYPAALQRRYAALLAAIAKATTGNSVGTSASECTKKDQPA